MICANCGGDVSLCVCTTKPHEEFAKRNKDIQELKAKVKELEAVVERKDIELMTATNPVVPKEEWKQYIGEWKTRAERAEAKIKRDEKRTVQEHRTFDHNEKLLKGQLETKDALLRNALDDLKYIVTCLECIEKATMKSIPLADRFRTTMANIKVEIQ